MDLKRIILLFVFSLSFIIPASSQGEIDDEQKIFFRNEKSWALFINTNGYGGNYRNGTRINAAKKFIWEIDMNYIKHPKETKISSNSNQVNQYVYGKMNFPWEIRGGVGLQKELYRKIDKSGVSVRYFIVGGPSLILLKPIYYQVWKNDDYVDEKFNPDPSVYQPIIGRSSFFLGFDEIKPDPGIYLKGGFSFEYSKKDNKLKAIEIGGVASAFLNEVEIMAQHNSRYLFSLFISFRWGKVIAGDRMEGVEFDEEQK
jgi:hypothetical protein